MARARGLPTRPGDRPFYRETSFDPGADDKEDANYSSSDSDAPPISQTRGNRSHRNRESNASDSDSQNVRRSSRLGRSKISLREPSSELDLSEELDSNTEAVLSDFEESEPVARNSRKRRLLPTPKSGSKKLRSAVQMATRSAPRPHPSQPKKPAPRPKVSSTQKSPSKAKNDAQVIVSDGFIPPWKTLPYHVLLSIFEFASWHYEDIDRRRNAWLLSAAFTCRSFSEPALTVLYNNLSACTARQMSMLLLHLEKLPENSFINYHTKIRRLKLDERFLPAGFDLTDIIKVLPALNAVDIWSRKDMTRGHPQLVSERWWTYPKTFLQQFDSLEGFPRLRLNFWRINYLMLNNWEDIELFHQLLARPNHPLNLLKQITITNHLINYSNFWARYPEYEEDSTFLPFLTKMQNLDELRFEFSSGFLKPHIRDEPRIWPEHGILNKLPSLTLSTLELWCCPDDSDSLAKWLASAGGTLRRLSIEHCQNLNLSFLPELRSSCPRLEHLYMNLIFFDYRLSSRIAQPGFEELITPDEVPAWPSTLKTVILQKLRKWTSDSAFVTFSSLIDAAPNLPGLRELEISASIDTAWHMRAAFREEWVNKFNHVFLRNSHPPNKHLVSRKAWRLYQKSKDKEQQADKEATGIGRLRKRRKGISYKSSDSDLSDATDDSTGRPKNRERPATRNGVDDTEKELFVQGMCDRVDIRIDNLRPTEADLHEDDFLDDDDHDESDEDYISD